jgi:Tfp pilus assembly protein PilV
MINITEKGQSLVEVVIALGIAITIVIAFTNATLSSVRNSQFAKDQNQATKHVQESLEIIRAIRDQDSTVGGSPWSALWTTNLSGANSGNSAYTGKCYTLDKTGVSYSFTMSEAGGSGSCSDTNDAVIDTQFKRKINISNDTTSIDKKLIRVRVYWTDAKGTHSSDISTYLTKWQ